MAELHTLVLLRHGQSRWNVENRFTGWTDVPITEVGRREAVDGARALIADGYDFDECHTSVLTRAIQTLHVVLEEMGRLWLPVIKDYRLNERHYGALQGLNKAETAAKHGAEQVFIWRRSFDVAPPALTPDDERYPANDPRYRELPNEIVPLTESLKLTVERVLPYWRAEIAPKLKAGRRLVISAHGNSIRALVKHLDGLSDEEITKVEIPHGRPLVYKLDADLKPVEKFYLGEGAKAA